jgi:Fis family transcriptional regulator
MTSAENSSLDATEETINQAPVISNAMQSQQAMQRYFEDLDGQDATDLYALVMNEVEPPLLAAVMNYTRQNQSRTAEMLGLNRGTLRKKLKQYNLL